MQEPAGLSGMATVSLVVHAGIVVFLFFGPAHLLSRASEPPRTVMTISLGAGTGGPQSGGMTPMGNRPVQTTAPAPVREAVRPPAVKPPEMTVPRPGARPARTTPAPRVAQAPDEARGQKPTRGTEIRTGSAVAETGTRGQGFGLSTGGSSGSGSTLDVADFCCPDYLMLMTDRIRGNWNQQSEASGRVVVRFVIQRDGSLTDVIVERTSGFSALDIGAQRAVAVTRQLPPLPAAFPNPTLTVHLNFEYQR